MSRKYTIILMLAMGLTAPIGCAHRASTAPTEVAEEDIQAQLASEAHRAPREPNLALPPPESITDNVRPLGGQALELAGTALPAVVAKLPAPEYLDKPGADPAAEALPPEDPVAVKRYILGRNAFLQGDYEDARRHLEDSLKLQPHAPQVLRLLGMVYFARGNQPRGAQYLGQAVRLQPDTQSLFLLGSAAYRRRSWDEAIVLLARATQADPTDADSAVRYLLPYYLGQALLQQGYLASAIEQLDRYLDSPGFFGQVPRTYPEIALLNRQQARIAQEVGDALCRLGRPGDALTGYYQPITGDETLDADGLAARTIYACLATHRPRAAEQALVDRLRSGGGEQALELVPYVAEHGGDRPRFAAMLRQVYEESDRPEALAIAVSQLLTTVEAREFLLDHLRHRPGDVAVAQRLIGRLSKEDPAGLAAAAVELIQRHPQSARDYAARLLEAHADPASFLSMLDRLPAEASQSAAAHYLRGAVHEHADRIDRAAQAYDLAIAADPSFLSPRLANVELQVRLRRYDRALDLLDKVPDAEADMEARFARARIYKIMRLYEEALATLDDLLREQPRQISYLLEKAEVLYLSEQFEEAENVLAAILNIDPTHEAAFAQVFLLLNRSDNPRWGQRKYVQWLQRAHRAIPTSPVTRFQTALYEHRSGQTERAISTARELLDERPGDNAALALLARMYEVGANPHEAVDLVLEHAMRRPRDPAPLEILLGIIQRDVEGKFTSRLDSLAQQMAQPPVTLARVDFLMRLNLHRQRFDESLKVLDGAIAHFPGHAPALHYQRSMVYQRSGDEAAAEAALLKVLEIDPDHPGANNDLGYLWIDQDRNIQQALGMVQKAVQANPSESAYLDSLGWAYYKLGDFTNAVEYLRRARSSPEGAEPVIIDHLGDALWRAGDQDEAVRQWRQAAELVRPRPGESPEITRVRTSLDAKLKAVQAKTKPPLASVPQAAGDDPSEPGGDP